MGRGESLTPVMPWGGMRIEEPGRGPWYQRKKENGGEKEVSCYATGWHENKGTRSRTVVSKEKRKMEEKGSLLLCLGGHENKETRSRTVVPKKKKKKNRQKQKREWRRKEASCYASGGMRIKESGRGPWNLKEERKWRISVMPRGGVRNVLPSRGREAKKKKRKRVKRERANEG